MKKMTFAVAFIAVTGLAVSASLVSIEAFHRHEVKLTKAAWKDVFDTPVAQTRGVDTVVLAQHVGTSPGRVAMGENPDDITPFELNHFVVTRGFKGLPDGASVTVERVGGTADGETILLDADGGPYVTGEEYVLFLNKQTDTDFYYLVNGEGRYSIDEGGRLTAAVDEGKVAPVLHGKTVDQFAGLVRESVPDRAPAQN